MSKKRSDGRFQKSVTIIDSGLKKRKYFYGRSKREINQKIYHYKESESIGKSFEQISEEWETECFPALALGTIKTYRPALRRAKEHFGSMPIRSIKAQQIYSFILSFANSGVAKKTVITQKIVVNLIFRYALIRNEIENNPVNGIPIPKNLIKTSRKLPTAGEMEIVSKSINQPFGLFFFLILYTGLRRGEALALKYEDIDKENNMINVSKSIYHDGNTPILKKPKTENAYRKIILLDCLKNILPDKKTGIIFSNAQNKWLTSSQYNQLIKSYCQKTGLKITAHQLRHAYATILYEAGIPDKDAQDLLGHAQISTTRDIYTHISERQKRETAKKLNAFTNDSF